MTLHDWITWRIEKLQDAKKQLDSQLAEVLKLIQDTEYEIGLLQSAKDEIEFGNIKK